MDLSNIPTDEEEIKKFKQEMIEAGIDEKEIEYPSSGYYDHPVHPSVKSFKLRSDSPTTEKAVNMKITSSRMYSNEQHRIYVQTVYDYFRENTRWPTYREVDNRLIQIDRSLDIEEIVKNLPSGFANSLALNHKFDEPAVLSLVAIKECQNSEEDLEDFLKAIRLFARRYFLRPDGSFNILTDELRVTGADLWDVFAMSDESILKVGELIKDESRLYSSKGVTNVENYGGTWVYIITRAIRRFDSVQSIDDYLERRDNPKSGTITPVEQLRALLGYMYCKPGSDNVKAGTATWTKNLTIPNEKTGAELEVALLNALTRLGIPTLFGGDVERILPTGGVGRSGPATPIFDLVALDFGSPMRVPTAVLISCKSADDQPRLKDMENLVDESAKVRKLLPEWQVFGTLVNLGEPMSDDFNGRDDVRLWKQSDLQALLHVRDYKYIEQFLWTPPWNWKRDIETLWRNTYKTHHKDIFSDD